MFIFVAFALSTNKSTNHSDHFEINGQNSSELRNLEHHALLVRGGDAKVLPDFSINKDFVDPDANCDFCTQVIYNPSVKGRGGILYQVPPIDLSDSKRLVFFVRGQNGNEEIYFVGAGKIQGQFQGNVSYVTDLFPDQSFGFKTNPVTLTQNWKRYEVNLSGLDLKGISYPFGFILGSNQSSENQIIYLKGVTYDSKSAINSMVLEPTEDGP